LAEQASGSAQVERDAFVTIQWQHAGSGPTAWSVTPYDHFNRVALNPGDGAANGTSMDDRCIDYVGVKADWLYGRGAHEVKAGGNLYRGFLRDRFLFSTLAEDGIPVADTVSKPGVVEALYVEDRYRPTTAMTISVTRPSPALTTHPRADRGCTLRSSTARGSFARMVRTIFRRT
jgi:hypothetical protein